MNLGKVCIDEEEEKTRVEEEHDEDTVGDPGHQLGERVVSNPGDQSDRSFLQNDVDNDDNDSDAIGRDLRGHVGVFVGLAHVHFVASILGTGQFSVELFVVTEALDVASVANILSLLFKIVVTLEFHKGLLLHHGFVAVANQALAVLRRHIGVLVDEGGRHLREEEDEAEGAEQHQCKETPHDDLFLGPLPGGEVAVLPDDV